MDIKEISTRELAEKLARKDKFKLIMTFNESGYKAKHIPGSLNIYSQENAAGLIETSDEIIVYCINQSSQASINAYHVLKHFGFNNIRRYSGGLEAWEEAGLELEGESTNKKLDVDDGFMK